MQRAYPQQTVEDAFNALVANVNLPNSQKREYRGSPPHLPRARVLTLSQRSRPAADPLLTTSASTLRAQSSTLLTPSMAAIRIRLPTTRVSSRNFRSSPRLSSGRPLARTLETIECLHSFRARSRTTPRRSSTAFPCTTTLPPPSLLASRFEQIVLCDYVRLRDERSFLMR